MIVDATLTGGFSDAVFQSQAIFRRVLDAFARPGTVVTIPAAVTAPAPLAMTTAALLASLADEATPVMIDGGDGTGAAAAWVQFHTGAPLATRPDLAAFAVITDGRALPDLAAFAAGTQDYPDRSTTVIVQVASVTDGAPIAICGPGIDGIAMLRAAPLPVGLRAAMDRNRAMFPRGLDFVLAAAEAIVAIPRSTRLAGGGA